MRKSKLFVAATLMFTAAISIFTAHISMALKDHNDTRQQYTLFNGDIYQVSNEGRTVLRFDKTGRLKCGTIHVFGMDLEMDYEVLSLFYGSSRTEDDNADVCSR